jgi:hypothetical protein
VSPSDDAPGTTRTADPWGVAAIVLGCVGIVVAGLLLCPVTGFVSAVAGAKAREQNRSLDNAYIGFGLAALDGIVWIVLHLMFDLRFAAG